MKKKKEGIALVILLAVFFLSSMAWAVDCPIPDTGQTKCYDAGFSEITCPQPGEDFYGQDTHYLCNSQSYTKLDENGNDLPDDAAEWVMVRDNITGLIWEVKQDNDNVQNYDNHHDSDNKYTWYDGDTGKPGDGTDTEDFISALNSQQLGGYDDWRLPTVKELSFILHSGTRYPAIDKIYFPNTESGTYYYSSTTYADNTESAWGVFFSEGIMNAISKSYSYYVRAVRGEQFHNDFIDNGDGTVTDNATNLMWQQATAPGTYTWEGALTYCEGLSLAGYDDWRLPDRNQLQSIVDHSTYSPAIDTTYFPDTVSSYFWSSTTYDIFPVWAWYVDFNSGYVNGGVSPYGKESGDYVSVRAVRVGQCVDPSTTTSSSSTTTISPSCPTEKLYGEHSEETELLRHFRDKVLSKTPAGQELIKLYYQWSPAIVRAMEADEEYKEEVRGLIDGVLELIEGGVE